MPRKTQPYHKYIFDSAKREFLGRFEEMYRAEETEQFDSWRQEDLSNSDKRIAKAIISGHEFQRIIDIGCGKGVFTSTLKTDANEVVGIDLSETAIAKARSKYPHIDFRVGSTMILENPAGEPVDLIVLMEILSYVEDWRDVIRQAASAGRYLLLSLYLPERPIGFVKSGGDLRGLIDESYERLDDVVLNRDSHLIFARSLEHLRPSDA